MFGDTFTDAPEPSEPEARGIDLTGLETHGPDVVSIIRRLAPQARIHCFMPRIGHLGRALEKLDEYCDGCCDVINYSRGVEESNQDVQTALTNAARSRIFIKSAGNSGRDWGSGNSIANDQNRGEPVPHINEGEPVPHMNGRIKKGCHAIGIDVAPQDYLVDGSDEGYPGFILAVGSSLHGDQIHTCSNTPGVVNLANGTPLANLAVAAPGANVVTRDGGADGITEFGDGTSYAAPEISAAAALLLQGASNLEGDERVRARMGVALAIKESKRFWDDGKPGQDPDAKIGELNFVAAAAVVNQSSPEPGGGGGGAGGADTCVEAFKDLLRLKAKVQRNEDSKMYMLDTEEYASLELADKESWMQQTEVDIAAKKAQLKEKKREFKAGAGAGRCRGEKPCEPSMNCRDCLDVVSEGLLFTKKDEPEPEPEDRCSRQTGTCNVDFLREKCPSEAPFCEEKLQQYREAITDASGETRKKLDRKIKVLEAALGGEGA
jgi:hypothetical protein